MTNTTFPMSREEMRQRGWTQCDVILISGDAYVDHPAFGCALIGRWLEQHGYRVGIIAQPNWSKKDDFMLMGRPKLFFGISSGNVDSMVANYSSRNHLRKEDDYSPGRKAGLRPDRAVIVYANRVREAYGDKVTIVLGGIEASLRRLAHYDYWDNTVRASILLDARAHILVYGMGERAVLEIATRLKSGSAPDELDGIRGTAVVRKQLPTIKNLQTLPSFAKVQNQDKEFNRAFMLCKQQMEPGANMHLVQAHGDQNIVVYPPALPLKSAEMDAIYAAPFSRTWHPSYDEKGGIPGLETVRFSVTSHRGCFGECSFCALFFHQGRIISSRSVDSILAEITTIAAQKNFKGTITDIGGPSANMFGARCEKWKRNCFCHQRSCLIPEPCPELKLDYPGLISLYRRAMAIPRVKHVFVGSGLRYDLLTDDYARDYLKQLCSHQISGILKVAPEHNDKEILRLMNKPSFAKYETFVEKFQQTVAAVGKKTYIVNYLITDHPGTTLRASYNLAGYLKKRHMKPEQVQDFLPTPMTRSTAMYHTGSDPFSGKPVYLALEERERRMHRALIQPDLSAHRQLADEALRLINAGGLPHHSPRPQRGTSRSAKQKKRYT